MSRFSVGAVVAVFRMTTMELEASLYHASDNISSIMSNGGSGKGNESANVGARRRKVRNCVSDYFIVAVFRPFSLFISIFFIDLVARALVGH